MTSLIFFITLSLIFGTPAYSAARISESEEIMIKLPEPKYLGDVSLEESLVRRRSVRNYSDGQLSLEEISQILWAAQGITSSSGYRTAPSAGALYPLEVYLIVGNVERVTPGIYRYKPKEHELEMLAEGDMRSPLANAALGQSSVKNGAVSLVLTSVHERITGKYGDRGIRYAIIEIGHAAQNVCLQAAAMELGALTIGAFYDHEVSSLLNLPKGEEPLYIITIGKQ